VSRDIRLTVAAVIAHGGRFLCVEERADGMIRINQPAGHLEPGESLTQGVIRETLEETAHDFEPDAVLGIYRWRHPHKATTYVRVAFTGRAGSPRAGYRLDEGIERAVWLSPAELQARHAEHRSPLVMACVQDHLAGRRFPLDLLRDLGADQA